MNQSYDNWKLSSPPEDDMVSQCCGAEYITDDNDYTFCSFCEDDCKVTERWQYQEDYKDYYDELSYEEDRLSK